MSAGKISLVNWMHWYCIPSNFTKVCASVVLPTPGMSSINKCPAPTGTHCQTDLPVFAQNNLIGGIKQSLDVILHS